MNDEDLKGALKDLRRLRNSSKQSLERVRLGIKAGISAEMRVEAARQLEFDSKIIEICESAIETLKGAPPSEAGMKYMIALEMITELSAIEETKFRNMYEPD